MNLDDAQRQQVRRWIEGGMQPAEVQKQLAEVYGLRLTYMEVRFLLADLDLKPKDREVAVPPPTVTNPAGNPTSAPSGHAQAGTEPTHPGTAGGVRVAVDQVTRPGAVVSGRVTFSDGKGAEWYLDQMGRLGLLPKEKGYKPSQSDVMEFQVALQDELAKLGM